MWPAAAWVVVAAAVAAVIGAVAGGLLGAATEEGLTRTQGVEITVREDDGNLRAYVQDVQRRTRSSASASGCAS